tara:strand:- start:1500 stop:2717 length:1218 start_codon:yes stop_codon:yes gene_type:complete
MPSITILNGNNKGRTCDLPLDQPVIVGRDPNCSLRIADPYVSRHHCHFLWNGVAVTIADLQSTGGITIKGQETSHAVIDTNTVVEIGNTQIKLSMEATPEVATAVSTLAPAARSGRFNFKDLIGSQIQNFEVGPILAAGNNGVVFKARDTNQLEIAALKIFPPEMSVNEEDKQRFVRAMKTMIPVKHPNIVGIINAGIAEGLCWIAMEYVDGEDLAQVIGKLGVNNMLDWKTCWKTAVDVGRGLHAAHHQNIVHRNLTPQNLLRREHDKTVLIGDLAIAKALEGNLAFNVTSPGTVLGDLPYLAPERTKSDAEVDIRGDLYSLGATLYHMLTGKPPIQGDTTAELIQAIRNDVPQMPNELQMSVNVYFQDLVMKLLSKNPISRHQTPLELLNDLKRIGSYANLSY